MFEFLKVVGGEQKGDRPEISMSRAVVLTCGSSSNRQLIHCSIPSTEDRNTAGTRSCIQGFLAHLGSPDCCFRDNPIYPAMR